VGRRKLKTMHHYLLKGAWMLFDVSEEIETRELR
jgi:hypothetical protein